MAGFSSYGDYAQAVSDGSGHYATFRKTPSQVTTAGVWFDLSMSPGNPLPQYYAATPLRATQLKRSTDGGINHGPAVSPQTKTLSRFLLLSNSATGLPMPFILADYLLFYPFVDTGTNDEQTMDNTDALPRHTDGVGVQLMAVSVASSGGFVPTFVVNYTNSDGVAGRVSNPQTVNAVGTVNGHIVTSSAGTQISAQPWISLRSGDKGVRSVQSVTVTSGTDVGLFALVLVKPLITGHLLEQTAPCDIVPAAQHFVTPVIQDDAFLCPIVLPNGSLSGVSFHGELETVYN